MASTMRAFSIATLAWVESPPSNVRSFAPKRCPPRRLSTASAPIVPFEPASGTTIISWAETSVIQVRMGLSTCDIRSGVSVCTAPISIWSMNSGALPRSIRICRRR